MIFKPLLNPFILGKVRLITPTSFALFLCPLHVLQTFGEYVFVELHQCHENRDCVLWCHANFANIIAFVFPGYFTEQSRDMVRSHTHTHTSNQHGTRGPLTRSCPFLSFKISPVNQICFSRVINIKGINHLESVSTSYSLGTGPEVTVTVCLPERH